MNLLLAIAICAVMPFSGCGRHETAALTESGENSSPATGAKFAELPLNQQTEQKLDPLTREDVELYLKVMRAAAERVKNPSPGDKSVLDRAKVILAGSASSRIPTSEDVKTLERASLVALSMDQIVAEELKLDVRAYRGIVEAVEFVIPNPFVAKPVGKSKARGSQSARTPLESLIQNANTANEKFLLPYRQEIESLMSVVRNPANLPK